MHFTFSLRLKITDIINQILFSQKFHTQYKNIVNRNIILMLTLKKAGK